MAPSAMRLWLSKNRFARSATTGSRRASSGFAPHAGPRTSLHRHTPAARTRPRGLEAAQALCSAQSLGRRPFAAKESRREQAPGRPRRSSQTTAIRTSSAARLHTSRHRDGDVSITSVADCERALRDGLNREVSDRGVRRSDRGRLGPAARTAQIDADPPLRSVATGARSGSRAVALPSDARCS